MTIPKLKDFLLLKFIFLMSRAVSTQESARFS